MSVSGIEFEGRVIPIGTSFCVVIPKKEVMDRLGIQDGDKILVEIRRLD